MTGAAWLLPVLFLTGLVAGLIDAIAGGGGLITIPVLLGMGLPPQAALGTNKLQASFGSGSAMFQFVQTGTIRLGTCREGIACTAIGAGLGALSVQRLDPGLLRAAIPFLLVAIALYTLFSPRLGHEDVHPRFSPAPFYFVAGLALGFYDGFFGPGTGSFWVMALMVGLGYNMQRATGYTKVMNFTSNIVALALFVAGGQVRYTEGLVMGAGQLIGARIGSRLVITRGTAFIRPVFITMVLAITARLIYQNYR
jgi:uncharacterized protein